MAQNNSEASSQRIQDDSSSNLECPICLQSCVHPVELPCSHIFCYLCIKGVVLQGPSGRCAICRQSIPHNVLTHPRLKDINQLYKDQGQGGNYQWYYEARGGGWWVYDVRTMQELERAFEAKQSTCQVLIAGQMYEIDFAQMIQYRVNNRSLFRRIKRDLASAEKRGVAGIRLNNQPGGGQTSRSGSGPGTTTTTTTSSRRRASPQVTSVDNQQQQRSGSGVPNQVEDTGENSGHSDDSSDDNEDEDSCSDHEEGEVDDEDDDDDMDLGEEDADDSESDCADECRDGARAPTRRSDRSNSSSNNQTSPPSTPSGSNGSANCSSSPVDKTGCVHHNHHHHEPTSFDTPSGEWRKLTSSPKPANNDTRKVDETSGGGGRRSRSRQSATPSPSNNSSSGGTGGNVQIGSIHLNSPINNNGSLTCILIGPSLRITIDYNGTTSPDEVL